MEMRGGCDQLIDVSNHIGGKEVQAIDGEWLLNYRGGSFLLDDSNQNRRVLIQSLGRMKAISQLPKIKQTLFFQSPKLFSA